MFLKGNSYLAKANAVREHKINWHEVVIVTYINVLSIYLEKGACDQAFSKLYKVRGANKSNLT